jgi:hypothetical protein
MSRFFSKIRYKLAAENQSMKYLRYAIGEIVLVVIGILIALQINNWNETRKESVFEQKVLQEILTSIDQNVNYLNLGMSWNNEAINSCRIILNHFDNNIPYSDSLDHHFSTSLLWFYPSINNNAYESLKSYGLHLIKNDTIRETLGSIYEWKYMDILNQRQDEYFYGTVSPVITDLFESYEFRGSMIPNNYDELKKSKKYKHILRTLISNRELQNQFWERIKNDRLKLAEMIKKELKK